MVEPTDRSTLRSLTPWDWLLGLPFEVRWFVDGKEKALPPLTWRPWGVGYLRGTPLVSVLPKKAPVNGIIIVREGEKQPAQAPAVLALSGNRWSVLIEEDWPEKRDTNTVTEQCARLLLGDRKGKLWTARNYAYVLERRSPGGRRLSTLQAEKAEVAHREVKEIKPPAGLSADDRQRFRPFLGVRKISDLTEGLDGRLYLLVKGEKGIVLDRYDPAQGSLERTALRLDLPSNGTLAAGRDALYLAAPMGDQGRWRISWEALEEAEWKSVQLREDAFPPDRADALSKPR